MNHFQISTIFEFRLLYSHHLKFLTQNLKRRSFFLLFQHIFSKFVSKKNLEVNIQNYNKCYMIFNQYNC